MNKILSFIMTHPDIQLNIQKDSYYYESIIIVMRKDSYYARELMNPKEFGKIDEILSMMYEGIIAEERMYKRWAEAT